MKTPRLVHYALGLLGVLAGGMAVGAPSEPAISVKLPQASYNVRLTGNDIVSPHLQLHHSRKELRGRAFDASTVLSLKEDEVKGTIGGGLVNLKVSSQGDTLRGEGGFLGRPAEVRLSPMELYVYVGGCTYRLKNTEGTYIGPRSCDRVFAPPTEVTLPEVFQELTPAEQVALLLLSLG
ncbi:hypothetical protein [Hyalangium rubrum]|uniref:Uncharacterized protein n=1 Tax=Hyalangium rubrum TaxID=3103134 RepID=A0ABU5GYD2_9BACT|nr:hypothetical protein [Hyalangium sp. s54d21]MDY7226202.1 hypothetical protein [Hyalangium sp. s54d21]